MKTTKKDWIYRVILLILLAIIWDIGAALTSPIFVPQKGAVFREFFLLIQNGTMLKAFRYYNGCASECRHRSPAWLFDENLPSNSKFVVSGDSSNAIFTSDRLLSTAYDVVRHRGADENRLLVCGQLRVHVAKRTDCIRRCQRRCD